jgi:hypothetical protein
MYLSAKNAGPIGIFSGTDGIPYNASARGLTARRGVVRRIGENGRVRVVIGMSLAVHTAVVASLLLVDVRTRFAPPMNEVAVALVLDAPASPAARAIASSVPAPDVLSPAAPAPLADAVPPPPLASIVAPTSIASSVAPRRDPQRFLPLQPSDQPLRHLPDRSSRLWWCPAASPRVLRGCLVSRQRCVPDPSPVWACATVQRLPRPRRRVPAVAPRPRSLFCGHRGLRPPHRLPPWLSRRIPLLV